MKKILAGACVFFALTANAMAGWTAYGNVTSLYVNSGTVAGSVYIYHSATAINPANCSNTTYRLDLSKPAAKEIVSVLMTAKTTSTSIRLFIDDANCLGANPSVLHVQIQ